MDETKEQRSRRICAERLAEKHRTQGRDVSAKVTDGEYGYEVRHRNGEKFFLTDVNKTKGE